MNNDFLKLDIEKFAHGYKSFYDEIISLLYKSNNSGVIEYLLTSDINSQYRFSDKRRSGLPMIAFLEEKYLENNPETFISFFNEILPNILSYVGKYEHNLSYDIQSHSKASLLSVANEFANLLVQLGNSKVFNVDFYFDRNDKIIKRKLDKVNVEIINSNILKLEKDNKIRYEECVSDFLSFNQIKVDKLFYNESLNNLKKVVENTLQNNFRKEDGTFPKIHESKQISNILFDSRNTEFETLIEYVIKNIHHEKGGTPKNFTEKEYSYLWLELNKILYLLNRYKK